MLRIPSTLCINVRKYRKRKLRGGSKGNTNWVISQNALDNWWKFVYYTKVMNIWTKSIPFKIWVWKGEKLTHTHILHSSAKQKKRWIRYRVMLLMRFPKVKRNVIGNILSALHTIDSLNRLFGFDDNFLFQWMNWNYTLSFSNMCCVQTQLFSKIIRIVFGSSESNFTEGHQLRPALRRIYSTCPKYQQRSV